MSELAGPSLPRLGPCGLPPRHAALTSFLAVATLTCLLTGLLGPGLVQHMMDAGIRKAIVWQPDSDAETDLRYRGVCDPKDPNALYWNSSVYLYNITNLESIRLGAKPKLAVVGPFSFIKLQCKLDVWWDADGHVISKDWTQYLPHPEGPVPGDADLDEPITTLNLALGGVVEAVHGSVGPATARLLDLLVTVLAGWRDKHMNGMFMHRTPRELLYGYEDPLLARLSVLLPPGTVPMTQVQLLTNVSSQAAALAAPPSTFDTGRNNVKNIWTILSDKGTTDVTAWPGGPQCVEHVKGTDGMQFKPGLHCKRDALQLWVGPLFRSTPLVCTGARHFYDVKVLRYWPEPSWNQPNPCKSQSIPGLLNITAPNAVGPQGNGSQALGTPLFISRPHFCGCDPGLRANVSGLPDCYNVDDDLSIWLDVEPITGITMRAAQSIMLSSQVSLAARQHVEPRMESSPIIPIMWQHETIQGKKEQAQQFVSMVYSAKKLKAHLGVWPLLLALIGASCCACVLVHASVLHSKALQALRDQETERSRRERQAIIERAMRRGSSSVASPARTESGADGGTGTGAGAAAAASVAGQGTSAGDTPGNDLTQPLLDS